MPLSQKSPVHPQAARLTDVHPSSAVWAIFKKPELGRPKLIDVGQFRKGFSAPGLCGAFLPLHVRPGHRRKGVYFTAKSVGLLPSIITPRFDSHDRPLLPPTDDQIQNEFAVWLELVRDSHNPYALWATGFMVKLQHAHTVLGYSREEFRRIYPELLRRHWEEEKQLRFLQELAEQEDAEERREQERQSWR